MKKLFILILALCLLCTLFAPALALESLPNGDGEEIEIDWSIFDEDEPADGTTPGQVVEEPAQSFWGSVWFYVLIVAILLAIAAAIVLVSLIKVNRHK